MMALKAKVKNGHLVLDEPTDLPEGTVVSLEVVQDEDPYAHLDERGDPFEGSSAAERPRLNASIDRGLAEMKAGKGRPLTDFARVAPGGRPPGAPTDPDVRVNASGSSGSRVR